MECGCQVNSRLKLIWQGFRLTENENDGSGRVGGETGGFQLLGAELGHLEVDGEESFVRADEVVGF